MMHSIYQFGEFGAGNVKLTEVPLQHKEKYLHCFYTSSSIERSVLVCASKQHNNMSVGRGCTALLVLH